MNSSNSEIQTRNAETVSEIVELLDRARELAERSRLTPQRKLPIPDGPSVNALLRRFKKDHEHYPLHDCSANRATTAAKIAAEYMGLNHEQKFFFYAFASHIAQLSHSRGFYEGLNYPEVKARRKKMKEAA